MIVYIAGKMTGMPDKGRAKFADAAKMLQDKGHIVLNPAELRGIIPPREPLVQFQIPEPIDTSWIKRLDAGRLALSGDHRPGGLP